MKPPRSARAVYSEKALGIVLPPATHEDCDRAYREWRAAGNVLQPELPLSQPAQVRTANPVHKYHQGQEWGWE